MLNMNDYLASERAYSNISQVCGRAGRGDKKGRALIETSEPENLILNYATHNDYEAFYANEINFREAFEYPPFMDLFMLNISSKDNVLLKKEADKIYNIFKNSGGMYKLFSPKVPFLEKINGKFRMNIMLKAKISRPLMDKIYENLKVYEKYKSKKVNLAVVRNPVSI